MHSMGVESAISTHYAMCLYITCITYVHDTMHNTSSLITLKNTLRTQKQKKIFSCRAGLQSTWKLLRYCSKLIHFIPNQSYKQNTSAHLRQLLLANMKRYWLSTLLSVVYLHLESISFQVDQIGYRSELKFPSYGKRLLIGACINHPKSASSSQIYGASSHIHTNPPS